MTNELKDMWKKVSFGNEDDCWEWTGHVTPAGYGRFGYAGSLHYTHVLAWMDANNRVPAPGMDIMHLCHNPCCCNPKHLHEGTRSENLKAAGELGRLSRRGETNGRAILTEELVDIIRASPEPAPVWAARLGMDRSRINKIRQEKSWKSRKSPVNIWLKEKKDGS